MKPKVSLNEQEQKKQLSEFAADSKCNDQLHRDLPLLQSTKKQFKKKDKGQEQSE